MTEPTAWEELSAKELIKIRDRIMRNRASPGSMGYIGHLPFSITEEVRYTTQDVFETQGQVLVHLDSFIKERMAEEGYKAYLHVRDLKTKEIIDSIGVSNLGHRYVEKVMRGMLINMNPSYFVDDSDVDEARKEE